MEDFLLYPQGTLIKEERDINIFIQKKIFKAEFVTEVPCNIDPESGLTDICITQDRIDYYSKYETILSLPAYLNPEQAMTSEEFFNELIFISDTKNFNSYENQKELFIKNTLEYNNWHISSYSLIPDYCGYMEAINNVVFYSVEQKIITEDSFVEELSKILNTKNNFELIMANSFQKAKAFYNIFNDKKSKDDKVICFFDRKQQ